MFRDYMRRRLGVGVTLPPPSPHYPDATIPPPTPRYPEVAVVPPPTPRYPEVPYAPPPTPWTPDGGGKTMDQPFIHPMDPGFDPKYPQPGQLPKQYPAGFMPTPFQPDPMNGAAENPMQRKQRFNPYAF